MVDLAQPATRHGPRRRPWRRVAIGIAVVLLLGVGVVGVVAVVAYRAALRSNVGDLAFRNELRIPPLLEPVRGPDGRRVFDLSVEPGQSRFLGGASTDTWGINGAYLGPTLRARVGDEVRAHVTNRVGEETTLHWHGMHLPAVADGGPHQVIAPGATWTASWRVVQPSATLWYHAHPEDRTGAQVYRGAAGMFILEDPATDPPALPHRYGVDDIPLIIQDRRFDDAGQFRFDSPRFSPIGVLGDEILLNGTHDPYLRVRTERVRLRVLNASNARTYNLGLSDDRAFTVIAGDGGYLDTPQPMRRLLVAPSERFEIVVDLRPGDDIILRSYPTRVGGGRVPARFAGGDDSFDLLRVLADDRLEPAPSLPERLPAAPRTAAPAEAHEREFTFNHASRLNGRHYDHDRIDFTMRTGEVETWQVRNTSDNQHVFHVHGVSFTVTAIDDRPPPAHLSGPKDSIFLPPGTTATIAVRAPSWADETQPYMFHCHVLAHEDHGMMGHFVVTDR